MQAFNHLIAHTHSNINDCKASGLNSLHSAINKVKNDIMSLEMSDCPNFVDHPQLLEMYAKYAALQRQVSKKWVQRTCMLWASDGDQNNSFFDNAVHIRKHFNFISHTSDLNGNVFNDRSSIEQDFISFYSCLWSNSSDDNFIDILNALPNDLPKLSYDMCDLITREVTREEIYYAVIDLHSGKSPGPNNLNAEFYHFYWTEIGNHLVSAVQFFFTNSVMLLPGGKLILFLIPKRIILF